MKVGIVTRHAVANYGSILQAYATQKAIENMGYESEIINYIRSDEYGKNIAKTMLKRNKFWNKNFITKSIYKIIQTSNYEKSFLEFEKFRRDFLKETKYLYTSSKELMENLPNEDVFCTGSDQVWGRIGREPFDKNYFLDFVPQNKRCISYAASFGKDNLNQELIEKLPELLKKYENITVREKSAKEIISKFGYNVEQVLDPTLLLTREQWEGICSNNVDFKDYVLIYQLHKNKKLEKYAEQFAKKVGKKLIRISISKLYAIKSGKLVYMPTPNEFLQYFNNAEYVISDSFHATVFSIIFNKKIVDVLPEGTGTRIVSILKLLNLENRIVSDYNDFSLINNTIDYEKVNKLLNYEREKSLNILKNMLIAKE